MKWLSGILFSALLVAGCQNGSSSSSGSTSTTKTTVTIAPTTTTQDVPGDKQAASTVVVLAADAGPAFKGTAHSRTSDADLGSCVNHDPVLSGTDYPTQADGEDLTNSAGVPSTDINSSVRIAPTVEAAMASMAALKAPGVLTCIGDVLKGSNATSGVTVTALSISPLTVPAIGDDVFGFKVVGTLNQTASASTLHSTFYAVVIRKGRVLSQLSVNGENIVPSLSLLTQLATTMATRSSAIH